jgi:hypothetical protein
MGDSHGSLVGAPGLIGPSATQRKPTHAGRGKDVVSRADDRIHTAPSWYEPPRIT